MGFQNKLTRILTEDTLALDTPVPDNALTSVRELAKELAEAKQNVADLERRYTQAYERLGNQLACQVRQSQPRLDVGFRNGHCSIGYCTKSLVMRPDLESGVWTVNSPDKAFARRFHKRHGSITGLDGELGTLVQAIVQYFTDHYSTL
jgi:hypothetical protein